MTAKHNQQDTIHGIKRPLDYAEEPPEKLAKLSTEDPILAAYKRLWNQLDLSNPTDARLESFLWNKIRNYNKRQ